MQALSKYRGKDFYRKITSHMIDKKNPWINDDTINKTETIDSNKENMNEEIIKQFKRFL